MKGIPYLIPPHSLLPGNPHVSRSRTNVWSHSRSPDVNHRSLNHPSRRYSVVVIFEKTRVLQSSISDYTNLLFSCRQVVGEALCVFDGDHFQRRLDIRYSTPVGGPYRVTRGFVGPRLFDRSPPTTVPSQLPGVKGRDSLRLGSRKPSSNTVSWPVVSSFSNGKMIVHFEPLYPSES